MKTCFEDVLKTSLEDVLKTFLRRLEDTIYRYLTNLNVSNKSISDNFKANPKYGSPNVAILSQKNMCSVKKIINAMLSNFYSCQ